MVKLNIGCGRDLRQGFINVDVDPEVRPDVVADISDLPFQDSTIDYIEANHILEHAYPWEAERALREWHRVLKPGGALVIVCPDLSKVCQFLARTGNFSSYSGIGLGGIYGRMIDRNPHMGHRWGYTADSLKDFLSNVGYVSIRSERPTYPVRDLRVSAQKPSGERPSFARPLRVFYFIHGDVSVASSRYQGYRVHEYLRQSKIHTELLLAPVRPIVDLPWTHTQLTQVAEVVGGDVAVFQKITGTRAAQLIQLLKDSGSKTMYIQCDYDPSNEIPLSCDCIVCPSESLVEYYRSKGHNNVWFIPDPAEFWASPSELEIRPIADGRIRICWVGEASKWHTLSDLREVLREPDFTSYELVTVSNHPDADVAWSVQAVRRTVLSCHVGVVPVGSGIESESKSANRVTLFMAAGLPVVAGPIPAYKNAVNNGVTGYIFENKDELKNALRRLVDKDRRKAMGNNAYEHCLRTHSPDDIGKRWIECLTKLNSEPRPAWVYHEKRPKNRRQLAARLRIEAYTEQFISSVLARDRKFAWASMGRIVREAIKNPITVRSAFRLAEILSRLLLAKGKRTLRSLLSAR